MSIGAAVAAFTLAGLSLAGLDSQAQGQLKAAQCLAAASRAAGHTAGVGRQGFWFSRRSATGTAPRSQ